LPDISALALLLSSDSRFRLGIKGVENIVSKVLSNVSSLKDLFSLATINVSLYISFKNHELSILQTVMKNMSPPAWEFREISHHICEEEPDSAAPIPVYTAQSYYTRYMQDYGIIQKVKSAILQNCSSTLRHETLAALKENTSHLPSRVDNALWRIWTFCRIFGSNRGREEDIEAQMDWLRGGIVAHQTTCGGTISTSESFFLSSALLTASDYFGRGNKTGLTAEELYDITELWGACRNIMQSFLGGVSRARSFGVFDPAELQGGDVDGEERMLGTYSPQLSRQKAYSYR
jgi:hypothetical protein